jgi:hypothetical protein
MITWWWVTIYIFGIGINGFPAYTWGEYPCANYEHYYISSCGAQFIAECDGAQSGCMP